MLNKLSVFIQKITDRSIGRKAMYAVFFLYLILISAVSYFHEPWYDEAQAWQIARCASIYDIIFTIPHFEGHPPFWHLLLMPFAKCGAPYEFSISFVNIVFIGAAVWLLMFRTKLPDIMKVTLPFTYFLCYQYAVLSRPYSLMALGFVLCALNYCQKNEHPMKMVLSLIVLCASSAYGLAYAFFICIAWLIELWNRRNVFTFIKEFVTSSAFRCLLMLLVFAVCILLLVIPSDESLVSATSGTNDAKYYLNAFLYTFLLLPFDATVGSIMTSDSSIFEANFLTPTYIPFCIISIGIYAVIVHMAVRNKKTPLLIPMAFMPIIFGTVFFYSHHMGIFILYLIFFTVVCFDDGGEKAAASDSIYLCFIYAVTAVQIVWSILSCVTEIQKPYESSRKIAEYLKSNGITDSYILAGGEKQKSEYNFDLSTIAVTMLPYFDENIFPAFNIANNNAGYVLDLYCTDEQNAEKLELIKKAGAPDYIIGVLRTDTYTSGFEYEDEDEQPLPEDYFDFIYKDSKYVIEADFEGGYIFKGHYQKDYDILFRREDK